MFGRARRIARRTARRASRRMVRREEWDDDQSQPEGLDDRLKKLADLHAAGELTDEEFARAKENLLGS
jgi:hypothetical protein